jgi:hypothetical protein
VTVHNGTIEKQKWVKVKARIIARFGTVRQAASIVQCHPNALRYTVSGRCPRVAKRLQKALQ